MGASSLVVIDSSVVIAILLGESDAIDLESAISDALEKQQPVLISAATALECATVARHRLGDAGAKDVDEVIGRLKVKVVPFDVDQLRWARYALEHYGKGYHRAGLNFGDCFSYALAKSMGEPLLFKGGDFAHTDIAIA
jgi:ribonuclease VapC